MIVKNYASGALGVILAILGLPSAGLAQDVEIGVAAAVNPGVAGELQVGDRTLVVVGTNVFHNERVITDASGQTQVLFLDESALTIGPNSELVIDEFVYDPNAETGKLAMSAAKGVFRLVGGKISKKTAVVLKTPTATIGIRGGIVLIDVAESGQTSATLLYGDFMTIESGGVVETVDRAGYTVTVESADAPPSEPQPALPEALEASFNQLESSGPPPGEGPGSEGTDGTDGPDAGAPPTLGSDQPPQTLGPPAPGGVTELQLGSFGPGPESVPNIADTNQQLAIGITELLLQNVEVKASVGLSIATPFSGAAVHLTGVLTSPADRFRLVSDFARFPGATVKAGIFTFDLGGCDLTQCSDFFTGRLSLEITDGLFPAVLVDSTGGFVQLRGTGFLTADREFVFYELVDLGARGLVIAGAPTTTFPTSGATFYAIQDGFTLGDSRIPFLLPDGGGALAATQSEAAVDTAIFWDISRSATAQQPFLHGTLAIVGQGAVQQSAISVLVGRVSGRPPQLVGNMVGSHRLATNARPTPVEGAFGDPTFGFLRDPFGNQFFGGTSPDYFGIQGFA